MKKNRRKNKRIYIAVVLVIQAGFGLLTACLAPKTFSENENRYLAQFPEFSVQAVLSGEFQEETQEAFSDQLAGRDILKKCGTAVRVSLGQRTVSDTYIAKGGYYMEKVTQEDIDQKQYLQNLRYVEYFAGISNERTDVILVPAAGAVLTEELPKNAPFYDADALLAEADTTLYRANLIDIGADIAEYAKQAQVYYRTDHHWTLLGAYAAYSAYCEKTGLAKHAYNYFQPKKVSEDFLGTLYSKVMPLFSQKDTVYAATNIPKASVVSDGEESNSVYDMEKLTQKDKYAFYFGGNYAMVTVTMQEEAENELLVVKDSYANCFVPFLMESFDKITMVDLRYYNSSMESLLKENHYNNILVLYEMSNFAADTNLYKLVH